MANRGTSDGRRPPNHGRGRGVSRRVEEEPQPIEVGDIVVTPSTLQDSFTLEGPSPHSEHAVDQMSFLQLIDNE
ncbi:hypothetical protein CR513_39116, partial [Mucuna pruriens]